MKEILVKKFFEITKDNKKLMSEKIEIYSFNREMKLIKIYHNLFLCLFFIYLNKF